MMIPEKVGLFIIDTLRYDCVNYQSDKKHLEKDDVLRFLDTPNLKKICDQSLCFTNCYSVSAATVQTVTSMFTGISQTNHGMVNNRIKLKRLLDEKFVTMAEIFKKLGYMTVYAGETSTWFKAHKLLRGFDYDLTTSDEALFEFLEKNRKERIFLFSLFEDVHAPYLWSFKPIDEHYNDDYYELLLPLLKLHGIPIPKEPTDYWFNMNKVDSSRKLWFPVYVQGVTKFDKGRFRYFIDGIKKTGFLDKEKSLLVITADHGDGKYKNEGPTVFNHNGDPFNETAKVPLIVQLPDLKHEIRSDLVSNIDIFKMILDLCTENKTENFINYKLDCINPLREKRSYAWYISVPELFSIDPIRYSILSRAIITKTKKFILRGRPETFLQPKVFDLPNEEFVIKLYLDLLVKDPTDQDIKNYVEKLQFNSITKKELYNQFLNSKEYRKKSKWFILDLEIDPFEERPIIPTKDQSILDEYLKNLQYLIDLDRPNIITKEIKKIEPDEKEIEEIEKELHKLGYI